MNPKSVKKYICEELAHGKPVQTILDPPADFIKDARGRIVLGEETREPMLDPDWVCPDLPDWNTVVQWLKDDEVFRSDYEHSMKFGAAYLADEMLILKDKLLRDPKSAPAYKAAMDMIKWATMIRDPKYSERTIQEIKNNIPQDGEVVLARIKQLKEELGIGQTVEVIAHEVVKKPPSEAQLAHRAKLKAMNIAKRKQP